MQQSAEFHQQHKQYLLAANSVFKLGKFYTNLGLYQTAITYYRKAYKIYRQADNITVLANTLNSIGNMQQILHQPDSALVQYQLALNFVHNSNDRTLYPTILQNIGVLYLQRQLVRQALSYFHQALAQHSTAEQDLRIHTNMAKAFMAQSAFDSTQQHLQTGKQLLKHTKDMYLLTNYYDALSQLYAHQHKTKEALNNFRSFSYFYDSIAKNNAQQQAQTLKTQYQKKTAQQTVAQQKTLRYMQALLLSLGLLLLASWAYYRLHLHKKHLQQLSKEKQRSSQLEQYKALQKNKWQRKNS